MSGQPGQPAPVVAASNSLGLAGFIVSLIGLFTCGLISPIGAILAFVGLFRQPRGLAIAGFVIGLIGSVSGVALTVLFFTFGVTEVRSYFTTGMTVHNMSRVIERHVEVDDNALPTEAEWRDLMAEKGISTTDAWGTPLKYNVVSESEFEITSAGSDETFGTDDDLDSDFDVD